MGENETLAALAAQIDQLRQRLEEGLSIIRQWDARVSREGIGATLTLRTEVKGLRGDVARLAEALQDAIEARQLKPPPAPWWLGLDRAGYERQLAELRDWVGQLLAAEYAGYAGALRPCWENHPEAVWELSTIRAEWTRVYQPDAEDPDRDLAGALVWHEKWLPGALARLAQSIKCDEAGCRVQPARRTRPHSAA